MKQLFKIGVAIAIFFLGFVTSKYISIPYFRINNELDPVALFSALVSVIVVYLFYIYIDKDKEDRVREKDLVLGRIEEVYQLIKDQSFQITSSSLEYSKAAANTKRITVQLKNIEELLKATNINHHKKEFDEVLQQVRSVKDLLTSYKAPKGELTQDYIPDIKVEQGTAYYSPNRMKQINSAYDALKTKVLTYQLKINRA
ncbi:hypothetical protein [Christiangramia forsetii]|nr:hypothetical protein [Christiangramia forsetii]GGG35391.1 hypothetical protein GCM10011532_18980 [Christiangramia forsetii]